MRASGDAFWLQPTDRNAFLDYEADLAYMIADKPITLLCTYPPSVSKAGDLAEVAPRPSHRHREAENRLGSHQRMGAGETPPRISADALRHWMQPHGFCR
jgi:hypothetical protein